MEKQLKNHCIHVSDAAELTQLKALGISTYSM